jgi:hypothetical protein
MQPPAKYLVIIDADGAATALLFDAARRQVADFDASTEEVAVMTSGISPQQGAGGTEWNHALRGHGAPERAVAQVYTLDV